MVCLSDTMKRADEVCHHDAGSNHGIPLLRKGISMASAIVRQSAQKSNRVRVCEKCGKEEHIGRGRPSSLCQGCRITAKTNPKKPCSVCGKLIRMSAESGKCKSCGRKEREKRQAAEQQSQRRCKRCDVIVGKGKSFCGECVRAKAKETAMSRSRPSFDCLCVQCGKQFTATVQAIVCSQKCKAIYGAIKLGRETHQHERICEVCGKGFVRAKRKEDAARCCSRECGFELQRREAAKKADATEARRTIAKLKVLFTKLRQCDVCKAAFVRKYPNQRLCGDVECSRVDARQQARLAYTGGVMDKPCKICGKTVEVKGTKRVFRPEHCQACSLELYRTQKRQARRKYQLRRNGITAKDAPRAIVAKLKRLIEKAGQRCPLCGLLMTKQIDPNNDRALEVDHYIPVAKGGGDTAENVRAICRKCNWFKSDFIPIAELLKSVNEIKASGGMRFSGIGGHSTVSRTGGKTQGVFA